MHQPITSRRALLGAASGAALTGGCASFFEPASDTGNNEPTPRHARRDEARRALHARARGVSRRLCVELRAGLLAPLGRDGSVSDDDLDPAAGHGDGWPPLSRLLPRHARRVLLPGRDGGGRRPDRRAASRRRLELSARLRRRRVARAAGTTRSARTAGGSKNSTTITATRRSTTRARREASQFLLRLYLERRASRLRAPLERAIRFVLDSQYPNGGWPQRFPRAAGEAEYIRHITFNDDVAGENIKFLLMVYQTLGDERALAVDPARHGHFPRHATARAASGVGPAASRGNAAPHSARAPMSRNR